MSSEKGDSRTDPESLGGTRWIPHWRLIIDQGVTTPEIEKWNYEGNGTEDDPYAVTWIDDDPRNPMTWRGSYKWMITLSMAFSTLAVSMCSSAFSGGIPGLLEQYGKSQEVGTLGLSLFVLGFAIGKPRLHAVIARRKANKRKVRFFGHLSVSSTADKSSSSPRSPASHSSTLASPVPRTCRLS
jgi:hypothetical protein